MNKSVFIVLIVVLLFCIGCGGGSVLNQEEIELALADLDIRVQELDTSTTGTLARIEQGQALLAEKMVNLEKVITGLEKNVAALEDRVTQLHGIEKAAHTPATTEESVSKPRHIAPTASSPIKPITANIQKDYERALSYHLAGEYEKAIQKFSENLVKYPYTHLTDNYHYWIGESHFGLAQYKKALDAFNEVLGIPDSNKREDALVMSGLCYQQLGKDQEAKDNYQQLIKEFPNSQKISFVKSRLNKLM